MRSPPTPSLPPPTRYKKLPSGVIYEEIYEGRRAHRRARRPRRPRAASLQSSGRHVPD